MVVKHPFHVMKLEVEVDRKISPVVRWITQFPGVRTYACCQGDPGEVNSRPMLIFSCSKPKSLRKILCTIEDFRYPGYVSYYASGISCKIETNGHTIRFILEWEDPNVLSHFVKQINKPGPGRRHPRRRLSRTVVTPTSHR